MKKMEVARKSTRIEHHAQTTSSSSSNRSRSSVQPAAQRRRQQQQMKQHQQQQRVLVGRIPLVYYLTKNQQLLHPHFIEVSVSSSDGLYLRDVFHRLAVLRGWRMPTMYSWSCKRGYRNGFVWQDLSENDLIPPVAGGEYILKGSEILDRSPLDHRLCCSNCDLEESPSPTLTVRRSYTGGGGGGGDGSGSPDPAAASPHHRTFHIHSPGMEVHRASRSERRSSASMPPPPPPPTTRTTGVSTDDGLDRELEEIICQSQTPRQQRLESNAVTDYSENHVGTLGSLVRADVERMNRLKIMAEESFVPARSARHMRSPANLLTQLVSCGKTTIKSQCTGFGLILSCNPVFPDSPFSSPPRDGCDPDRLWENQPPPPPKISTTRFFTREMSLSGGVSVEEDVGAVNRRHSTEELRKGKPQPKTTMTADGRKNRLASGSYSSSEGAKRSPDAPMTPGSLRESAAAAEKLIKIEERLSSGARVVIRSSGSPQYTDDDDEDEDEDGDEDEENGKFYHFPNGSMSPL